MQNSAKNKIIRDDLGKTISNSDLKQFLCFIGFLVILGIDLGYFKVFSSIQNVFIWYYRLIIAIPLTLYAIIRAKKSLFIMYGEVRIPPSVIKEGPFRHSRHPMYFSALLIYFGILFFSFSMLGVVYYLGILFFYRHLANFEEKHLIIQFPIEYKEYMKTTPKWFG